VHPLQGGLLRLKRPSERRPGLARESGWSFWPRFAWQTVYKHAVLLSMLGRLLWLKAAIVNHPNAKSYRDQSLMPVADDDDATLDLLTKTTGAIAAVAHIKKVAGLTGAVRVA
jgi:hypothetical protein